MEETAVPVEKQMEHYKKENVSEAKEKEKTMKRAQA